jgi:hypothetical protein
MPVTCRLDRFGKPQKMPGFDDALSDPEFSREPRYFNDLQGSHCALLAAPIGMIFGAGNVKIPQIALRVSAG